MRIDGFTRGLQTEVLMRVNIAWHRIPCRSAIWAIFVRRAQDIHGHHWGSTIAITYAIQDLVRIQLYNVPVATKTYFPGSVIPFSKTVHGGQNIHGRRLYFEILARYTLGCENLR